MKQATPGSNSASWQSGRRVLESGIYAGYWD
jgi:hypothetical protein